MTRDYDDGPERSPAYQLVELVWDNIPRGASWVKVNSGMQDALSTAIKAGLPFEPTDIGTMFEKMRGSRWFSAEDEWIHREACVTGNTSAAVAYEKWAGRQPFILEGRLYVGRVVDFRYLPEVTTSKWAPAGGCAIVTSFSADGVNVCVYASAAPFLRRGETTFVLPGGKPIKRIKLTLDEVRKREKARKTKPSTPAATENNG